MVEFSDMRATGTSIEWMTFDPYGLDYQRLTSVMSSAATRDKVVGLDSAVRIF